jgi:hypothetical protein
MNKDAHGPSWRLIDNRAHYLHQRCCTGTTASACGWQLRTQLSRSMAVRSRPRPPSASYPHAHDVRRAVLQPLRPLPPAQPRQRDVEGEGGEQLLVVDAPAGRQRDRPCVLVDCGDALLVQL